MGNGHKSDHVGRNTKHEASHAGQRTRHTVQSLLTFTDVAKIIGEESRRCGRILDFFWV
jgi:hypothetical protein